MSEVATLIAPSKTAPNEAIHARANSIIENSHKPVRIFVVDDNAQFVLAATRFLSSNPRFKVVGSASSGGNALEQIGALMPDLVIMDLIMPVMSGIDAVRLIKALSPATRVLLISFQDGAEYHSSARTAGAEGFLEKSGFGEQVGPFIEKIDWDGAL